MTSAAALALVRACRDRAFLATGDARWIWCTHDIRQPSPVRFSATRDFVLGKPPGRAVAKLFGDRRWQFFVNGARVGAGEQRPGDRLQVFDVTSFLRRGANRVSIQVESPSGAGGILFSLDPGGGQRAVVSDATWRIESAEGAAGVGPHAVLWGRPPMYPWGYPRLPEADR